MLTSCLMSDPVEVATVAPDTRPYTVATGAAPASAYSGVEWGEVTATIKNPDGGIHYGAGGGLSMHAYTDAGCTLGAANTLNVTSSWIVDGVAHFTGLLYNWHEAHNEGNLYYRINTSYGNVCNQTPVYIMRKFNEGYGYNHFGSTGAAGGTVANTYLLDYVRSSQIDSAGRYVIIGYSKNASGMLELAIWRYNRDGTPDTDFGGDGAVNFGTTGAAGGTVANTYLNDVGTSLQIDSAGRYVIAGYSKNASGLFELVIWRYNSNGTPDTDFGGDGAVNFGTTGAAGGTVANTYLVDIGRSLVIDSLGRYVVAGYSKNASNKNELAIWRYNSNGTPDTDFGGDGAVNFGITGAAGGTVANTYLNDYGISLQIDSAGRYVVAGYSKNASNKNELAIWRYNSNGTPDTDFGGDGAVNFGTTGAAGGTVANTYLSDSGMSLQIDSAGRYVITGNSINASNKTEMAIWRYNSNGTPDTDFGGDGAVNFGTTGAAGGTVANTYLSDYGASLQIDSAGRYVVAGQSKNASNKSELAIWRYNSNGTPDTDFGGDGAVNFGTTGAAGGTVANTYLNDVGSAFQIDSAGRYVIGGISTSDSNKFEMAIWRYLSGGTLDL